MFTEFFSERVQNLGHPNTSGWAQGKCPFHDDKLKSFSVHLETGSWKCFANCGKGGLRRFKELAGLPTDTKKLGVKNFDYVDAEGNLVYRKTLYDDGSWGQSHKNGNGEWAHNLSGVKRIPYRLPDLLKADVDEPIFIVEGEKCADYMASCGFVAVTTGGATSWTPEMGEYFKGRHVVIWRDNDGPGLEFDKAVGNGLKGVAASIKHFCISEPIKGGDAVDWFLRGGTPEHLRVIVKNLSTIDAPELAVDGWQICRTNLANSGATFPNLELAYKIIKSNPNLAGHIWFDEFHKKILSDANSKSPVEWSDNDDLMLTVMIQSKLGIKRIGHETVSRAVKLYASEESRNECKAWMESLAWDGEERISRFFSDAFGADDNNYTSSTSFNFWVSIIARIFDPGCQVDNMVVLEGAQGIGKSRALRILGGQWYCSASESVINKDFKLTLLGKMMIEIAELDSFRKAEVTKIKQVVSDPHDYYRLPYGHRPILCPRMCVFVGTTNEHEYLRDDTGGRRFWPIKCSDVNIDYIEKYRNQFYAEAVTKYFEGARWWGTTNEVTMEQEIRRIGDPWEDIIKEYLIGKSDVTITEILAQAINMSKERMEMTNQKRVGSILRLLGWEKFVRHDGDRQSKAWKKKQSYPQNSQIESSHDDKIVDW